MSNTKQMHGSCLCGAVGFIASPPVKWCAHCHCSMCRKQHGAGYITWVGMESEHVEIRDPDSHLVWYESSPGAQRGFCSRCGSSLFFRSNRWAGELHIARAAFDGKIGARPQANAFFDAHVDWMPIDETLTNYPG